MSLYMRCSRLISCFYVAHMHVHASLPNRNAYHFIPFSADLGEFTNNYATWTVALPANWSVVISLEDGHSDEAWSQPVRTYATSPFHFHLSRTPSFSTHGIISLYILDLSSTERQYQLLTPRSRCAPQRPLVSIKTIMPNPPTPSPPTDPRAVSVFFFSFLSFILP